MPRRQRSSAAIAGIVAVHGMKCNDYGVCRLCLVTSKRTADGVAVVGSSYA